MLCATLLETSFKLTCFFFSPCVSCIFLCNHEVSKMILQVNRLLRQWATLEKCLSNLCPRDSKGPLRNLQKSFLALRSLVDDEILSSSQRRQCWARCLTSSIKVGEIQERCSGDDQKNMASDPEQREFMKISIFIVWTVKHTYCVPDPVLHG